MDKVLKIGDWVGFKSDIEQSGQIIKFLPDGWILLGNENGFHGDYIGGQTRTQVARSDIWTED